MIYVLLYVICGVKGVNVGGERAGAGRRVRPGPVHSRGGPQRVCGPGPCEAPGVAPGRLSRRHPQAPFSPLHWVPILSFFSFLSFILLFFFVFYSSILLFFYSFLFIYFRCDLLSSIFILFYFFFVIKEFV
jgi:hypothetical protein